MKRHTVQNKKRIPLHMYVWSLFGISILAYCGTVGMITFDVVGRKSLNQEAQKIAAEVARQEERVSEKTKVLSMNSVPQNQSHVVAYIDSRDVEAIGFAQ